MAFSFSGSPGCSGLEASSFDACPPMALIAKRGSPELLKRVADLTKSRVLVGVPAEDAGRDPEEGEEDGDINNAALAYIHDNGAPEVNIPARPFMRPGIADAESRIAKRFKSGAIKAFKGEKDAVEATFEAVGLMAQVAVRKRIQDGPFVPLAPETLAARLRRGRFGERPLIDTGQLRNSIAYVIRKRGGG
ncbi:hypothetical protein LB518_22785 [Mesorhizobium sp. BR1-1-16]|uniref:hypothetical protein n=1 Tax=Mesorhizobium sp. BR1-1-16 TaxID=2876653 RepID=UPI001CC9DC8D|nr:hypothetical protein [Mesorhizobium sp. BR1-1-16]MBZ9939141.1 hypothetical protein [Mesorhizobium sp. BR1-1-16]